MTPAEFLTRFRPGGPWVLTAIAVDQKAIDTATLRDADAVDDWVARFDDRNHYYSVNPTFCDVSSKADRSQIASVDWLHLDLDGEDKERLLAALDAPPAGCPRPTLVVDSGGGYQAFWRLREGIALDGGVEAAERASLYNLQLELLFGGDHCHNIDRIMRLPGTLNRPGARKRARGRVECLAVVKWFDDVSYDLSLFSPAVKVGSAAASWPTGQAPGNVRRISSVDELVGLSDRARIVVVQGRDPDDVSPERAGWSRSEWLFYACCEMVRAGLDDDVIYSVITDRDLGISASVLDKGRGVDRYAMRQIERAREQAVSPLLRRFNDRYAVIRNAGRRAAIAEEIEIGGRTALTLLSAGDLGLAWGNEFVEVDIGGGRSKRMRASDWWLAHPGRRSYDRIVFSPDVDVPGAYNLWRGFACSAVPGDCSGFMGHLHRVICSGDESHFHHLLNWMASCVQRLSEPGRTAIVLRGRQGTGKSFAIRVFGSLFGRHFLTVSDPSHLVGRFNAHLADCLVLYGDEAFYAGDKRHESVLKSLVTEDSMVLERKGVDAMWAPNRIKLLLSSNERWVVPAGVDDRRFFVLDVSPDHAEDAAYFRGLEAELARGGREAFLYLLLNRDLSGWSPRSAPKTDALMDQKELSLEPGLAWWLGKLRDGRLSEEHDEWTGSVPALELQASFDAGVGRSRGGRAGQTALGMLLRRVCPGMVKHRGSDSVVLPNETGRLITVRRPYYYWFPDLTTCRAHWDSEIFPIRWPDSVEDGTLPVKGD